MLVAFDLEKYDVIVEMKDILQMRKNDSHKLAANSNLGFSDERQLQAEIQKNQIQNMRIGNAEVKLIGDKMTLVQVVKLLSYVRHAINSHQHMTFTVDVGSNVADGQLMFDVNGFEVPDYITQDSISIN